ncbi:MAG: GNAT family N-acetyltransferase, partial [Tissierellales bacterium]|nr:GNAT family N-acetyltransferase [Tissierellales bacterium]
MRSVEEKDAETLRNWKNEHKEHFFFKKEISKDDQLIWFKTFHERLNDFMFIIEDKNQPIGCIGARLYQESIDIYNVILGDKKYKGKHVMKNALWATVSFSNLIYYSKPVRVKVLTTNPAREWY